MLSIHYIYKMKNNNGRQSDMRQLTLLDKWNIKQKNSANKDSDSSNKKQESSHQRIDIQNSNRNRKQKYNQQNKSVLKKKNQNIDTNNQDQDYEYQKQQQEQDLQQYEQMLKKSKNKKSNRSKNSKKRHDSSQQDSYSQQKANKKKKKESKSLNKSNMKAKQTVNINSTQIDKDDPLARFTDATPKWAQKQYCLDSKKRPTTHPDYDPTTLYIPQQEMKKLSLIMRQYWKIKSENFDKIILFKLGKFYQLFYQDAAITNKYLNLKYMGTKMHTGFPQKSLQKHTNQLVQLGYKVVIVQQMQTPQQMAERVRLQNQQGRKSQKAITRSITQILTKGTMLPCQQIYEQKQLYLPNYLLVLRIYENNYAFSLLEIGTNQIAMGIVHNLQNFKTVLYQTRPVQILYDPDNIPYDIVRLLQCSFLNMQLSKLVNKNNLWHPLTAICQIQRLEKQDIMRNQKIFQNINQMKDTYKNLMYSTLAGMFDYLKKVMKFQYVIGTARFLFYQEQQYKSNMILDSQALQHLQIFQTALGQDGSLFKTIDRTKTKFGRRLLRKWLISPLINIKQLNQRLNCLQDLHQNPVQRDLLTSKLKKMPDLQKKVNKLYHYAVQTTAASKAVYFQDLHFNRLKQFRQFMEKLQQIWNGVIALQQISVRFKSERLKKLVNLKQQKECEEKKLGFGFLPNVQQNLQQFKTYVKWENNTPIPQKGLVANFDQLQQKSQKIKQRLQHYIDQLRYQLSQPNLKFAHTKQRYQIQIPEKSDKKRPNNFQFSSKRAGYSRYASPQVRLIVKQLQRVQQNLKQQMGLFVGFFFQQFKKKHAIWHKFVQILAELDCLISLSQYSFLNSKVRPQFCQQSKFQIKQARHPCLTNIQFIPNDIILHKKVILLTGPNMGGKSTILRTSCILAVLAQIGCYVPAQQYICCPIDRIFTRIGASDKLQLGKSTFFTQLQQTKSVIVHGTQRSLAIIDQLGRGTSTFDGLAIAYSVLNDIIERVKCFCLFATHYHILLEEFKNNIQVQLMKMGYIMKQDKQDKHASQNENKIHTKQIKDSDIVFLYKLIPGKVQKSFGLNIAKKVGISQYSIKIAEEKAQQMNRQIQNKRKYALKEVLKFIKKK